MSNKDGYKFAVFDIKEFYPSIREQLMKEALDFANSYIYIYQKMTKRLSTTQENHSYLTSSQP